MKVGRRFTASVMFGLVLIFSGLRPATAGGDGGTLRTWKLHGDYEVAVFTDPSPPVVGPLDISVLLLDRKTGEPDKLASVTVEVTSEGKPGKATRRVATEQAATNKLLRAATFELSNAGRIDVEVIVDGANDDAVVSFGLIVGRPWAARAGVWPWILWPFPAIGFYGVHRQLVRRGTGRKRSR